MTLIPESAGRPGMLSHGSSVYYVMDGARQRALSVRAGYTGDLYPREAWLLVLETGARIVDVRTRAEWTWVGHARGSVLIEWETFPGNRRNPRFVDELSAAFSKDDVLLFMCRSGKRSVPACKAAAAAGFRNVYNILEGFEGDLDDSKHRNASGGWRCAGLPWVQT